MNEMRKGNQAGAAQIVRRFEQIVAVEACARLNDIVAAECRSTGMQIQPMKTAVTKTLITVGLAAALAAAGLQAAAQDRRDSEEVESSRSRQRSERRQSRDGSEYTERFSRANPDRRIRTVPNCRTSLAISR